MRFMRITAIGGQGVCVQISEYEDKGYTQEWMNAEHFTKFIQYHFPKLMHEFLESEDRLIMDGILHFFYHYGETPEMIRAGEAFIYDKEKYQ